MAPILFGRAILRGEPIALFNHGQMRRDFTYVDDVVEAIVRVLARPPDGAGGAAPYRVLNVGNSSPVELDEFVATLERHLGRKAERTYLPMQPGDVPATWADTAQVEAVTGFAPRTPLDEGLRRMAEWLVEYDGARRG
jgi:UDP-glucuronate 4-epimerase